MVVGWRKRKIVAVEGLAGKRVGEGSERHVSRHKSSFHLPDCSSARVSSRRLARASIRCTRCPQTIPTPGKRGERGEKERTRLGGIAGKRKNALSPRNERIPLIRSVRGKWTVRLWTKLCLNPILAHPLRRLFLSHGFLLCPSFQPPVSVTLRERRFIYVHQQVVLLFLVFSSLISIREPRPLFLTFFPDTPLEHRKKSENVRQILLHSVINWWKRVERLIRRRGERIGTTNIWKRMPRVRVLADTSRTLLLTHRFSLGSWDEGTI